MKNIRFFLHLLLLTALTAALYPLLVLLRLWSGAANWTVPVMTAALVACAWMGTLFPLLLRRQYARHPRWINGCIWGITLLLCLAGIFAAPYPTQFSRILLGLALGGCFFGGARLVFHPLEHLAHAYVFVGLCIWNCFSGFLIYLNGAKLPFLPMVLLFAGNAALFALVHNRDAMERMLSGRDGDTWELPTEIRRSNGKLMGILCGTGLVLILCSRPLAKAMRWLWRWFYTGCFYALRWLLSLGSTSDTADMPESANETLMQLPQSSTSGWVRLVIELVLLAAALALVIWKRHEIGDAILSAWLSLRQWFRAHLQKNHAAREEQTGGAYCDYVEDLLWHEKPAANTTALHGSRSWKKAYRRYHKLSQGAERFRLGYALLLAKLPEDAARPSDSPAEIFASLRVTFAEQEYTLSQWETVTNAYNALRYGDVLPEREAFLAMDMLLKQEK